MPYNTWNSPTPSPFPRTLSLASATRSQDFPNKSLRKIGYGIYLYNKTFLSWTWNSYIIDPQIHINPIVLSDFRRSVVQVFSLGILYCLRLPSLKIVNSWKQQKANCILPPQHGWESQNITNTTSIFGLSFASDTPNHDNENLKHCKSGNLGTY